MKKILVFILLIVSLSFKPAYNLQDEIDNASRGGTVEIPCGLYEVGTVTIDKPVTLAGCGHGYLGQSPEQGSGQWDYLLENYHDDYVNGTVLRGEIISSSGVYLRDFSMIGYGQGTGIHFTGSQGGISGVQAGNYDTCFSLDNAYYISVSDVFLSGCGVALDVQSSNRITITHLDIMSSGTGIVNAGNGNSFDGVSVQASDVGFDFGGMAGMLSGCYFEQNNISLDISGRGHTINGCYFAVNAGDVIVSGINNIVYVFETDVNIKGWYNQVLYNDYYQCINTAWTALNKCERPRE